MGRVGMIDPGERSFFIPHVRQGREIKTGGGDKAEAETPTSRRMYIYTSAPRHAAHTGHKKFLLYFSTAPGVTETAKNSGNRILNFLKNKPPGFKK